MNKSNLLVVASLIMAISFQSCKKNTPPSNPKEGQVYKDDKDNTWTWNNALGCWMIMNAMNNSGGASYYYPGSNRWTNSSGITTTPPSYISTKTTESLNKEYVGKSTKSNSNKVGTTSSNPASKPKSGGFGSSSSTKIGS